MSAGRWLPATRARNPRKQVRRRRRRDARRAKESGAAIESGGNRSTSSHSSCGLLCVTVPGSDSDSARIDPKLVKNFKLFREPAPGPDGPLDEAQLRAIASLPRHLGAKFVLSRTAKVVLDGGLTLLVVPGTDGVLMLAPGPDGRFKSAAGAPTEALLKGNPVGSSGSLIFGLAVDRIRLQSVRLHDGSTVEVPIRRNVYAVDDPTWQPPGFTN
jgi:hypothetical protein